MIQKLRRKFVLILMGVVSLILLAVFVSMLLSALAGAHRMSETVLRQTLAMHRYPADFQPPQAPDGQNPPDMPMPGARLSVLVADIDASGGVEFIINQLYFIEADEAVSIVRMAINSPGDTGVLNDYGLRWLKSEDGTRVALADISMEQEMLKNLILNALPIGGAALAAFFFISLFLARWAISPVERAWERQRQFVADASHELKTPLTVILSNADMLSGAGIFTDEKKSRRLEHIRAEATRMRKLIEDLLTLAKTDSAENTGVRERVDFSFVVTGAALTFETVIYDDKKNLSYDVRDNLFVIGDTSRLQQLLGILLDNAVKYCPEGGQIKLGLKADDKKTLLLRVTNDGESIPAGELDQIFERFYQTDKSRSAHSGFGLGLSIARNIVAEHGGKIWAENGSETGITFYVSLPLAQNPNEHKSNFLFCVKST